MISRAISLFIRAIRSISRRDTGRSLTRATKAVVMNFRYKRARARDRNFYLLRFPAVPSHLSPNHVFSRKALISWISDRIHSRGSISVAACVYSLVLGLSFSTPGHFTDMFSVGGALLSPIRDQFFIPRPLGRVPRGFSVSILAAVRRRRIALMRARKISRSGGLTERDGIK